MPNEVLEQLVRQGLLHGDAPAPGARELQQLIKDVAWLLDELMRRSEVIKPG